MLKSLFSGTALVVAAAGASMVPADEAKAVTFTTSASQLCVGASGCGVATQTIGGGNGVRVTYNPTGGSVIAPSFVSFGQIIISCVLGGTACGNQSLAGLNLYLNISQTSPTVGNGSITSGVVTGTVRGTASSALITWSVPNAINIGPVTYSVVSNPLALAPPSLNSGTTTIQGLVSMVPEPSTWGLMLGGFVLAGSALRRRKAVMAMAAA